MRRPDARHAPRAWVPLAALLLGAACSTPPGPPPIAIGAPCVACGMGIQDLRFACERRVREGWRVYDAIECLTRDAAGPAPADGWLADYDTRTLFPAESLWVVRGSFASPMGGGLAAFRSRGAADSVAAATDGRVARLSGIATGAPGAPR